MQYKRTSRLTILFRMLLIPGIVALALSLFCGIRENPGVWIGCLVGLICPIVFLWMGINLIVFMFSPSDWWKWKKGGGDPFFDTADPPFNNDPDCVRYQELYEADRQKEMATFYQHFQTQAQPQQQHPSNGAEPKLPWLQ